MGQSGIIPWKGSSREVFEGRRQGSGEEDKGGRRGSNLPSGKLQGRRQDTLQRALHCRRPGVRHDRDELMLGWRLKSDGRILGPVAHS